MLAKLRARLKELVGEITTMSALAELSAEQMAALTKALEESKQVEAQIKALVEAEQLLARAGQPADQSLNTGVGATVPAAVKQPATTEEKIGVMVFCMAKAYREDGAKGAKATFKAMEEAGYGSIAKEYATAQRALNASSPAAGGVLIPETMANEIVPILRPASTFLRGDPRRVPMANGSYKLPAAASGATSGWRGEGKAIQASQPTFKEINLTTKFLDSLVPLTNQLQRWSLPDVSSWVRADMAASIGTELDRAAYFGSGTVNEPLGLFKITGIGAIAATGGLTPTVAQIETGCLALELGMMNRNVPVEDAAWRMSPRVFGYLSNLRDGNGNRYFPELQNANPTFRNKPVLFSTQIPINGGGTTDESTIALVRFADVMLGEGIGLSFAVSTEATYVKNGVTVSAFQNDLTLIKASMEADVDIRYLESVQTLTGVRWGA